MRVFQKKNEDDIRNEFFGPLNEAWKKRRDIGIDPRKTWCELAMCRLMQLICLYKPVGINGWINISAISEKMMHVSDDESPSNEIYLSDENKERFREQQRLLVTPSSGVTHRLRFPTKFMCRPTYSMVEAKIKELYDMQVVEQNEGIPDNLDSQFDYYLTDSDLCLEPRSKNKKNNYPNDVNSGCEGGIGEGVASKRKRIATPEEN